MSSYDTHAWNLLDASEFRRCLKCGIFNDDTARHEPCPGRLAQPEPAALKHETCLHESKFLGRDGFRCHDCGLWLGMPEPAACEVGVDLAKPEADRTARMEWNPEPLARDMTVRERFAMAAMQGLLADPGCSTNRKGVAKASIEYADALLASLQEKRDDD